MAEIVESNQLQVILDEQNVPAENAKALLEAFGAPFTEAGLILSEFDTDDDGNLIPGKNTIVVTDESETELMEQARTKRLALKRIRTGVENKRKELKEDIVKTGRVIDAVATYVKNTIEPAEKYLELQEKFVEIQRAEKAAKLKAERIEELSKYTDDLSIYNFDTMREEAFVKLRDDLKAAQEEKLRKEKEEADRIEAERLAEIERQKEVEAENARLKEEARAKEEAEQVIRSRINATTALGLVWNDEKQAYIKDEFVVTAQEIKELNDSQFNALVSVIQKKLDQIAKENERAAEIERKDREAQAERERKKAEADRLAREKLEKDEQDRKEKEAKAQREREDAERAEILAPDKDKINKFNDALGIIRADKLPAVKSKQAQDIVNDIDEMFVKMQQYIAEKVKAL